MGAKIYQQLFQYQHDCIFFSCHPLVNYINRFPNVESSLNYWDKPMLNANRFLYFRFLNLCSYVKLDIILFYGTDLSGLGIKVMPALKK